MRYRTILIDSPEFESVLSSSSRELCPASNDYVLVGDYQPNQRCDAYSSELDCDCRDIFSSATGEGVTDVVAVYGALFSCIWVFDSVKSVALSETVVLMERFDLRKMWRAVGEFRVTDVAVAVALPVLVTMAKGDVTDGYDLRLVTIICLLGRVLESGDNAVMKSFVPLIRFVFQVGDKTREDVDYSEEEIDRGFQEFAVGSSYVQDTRELFFSSNY
ncbi:unnamed protein product [Ilex paraguariensis]|uniref:Uncharacterized protein n=1 Tax=Ilex paraguariensis TaxID=185542 RepID=A0ABC8TKU4_9AQUA